MSFQCKFCGRFSALTKPQVFEKKIKIEVDNCEYENVGIQFGAIACPNPECRKLHLSAEIFSFIHQGELTRSMELNAGEIGIDLEVAREYQNLPVGEHFYGMEVIRSWDLLPKSRAIPLPGYIPEEIRKSYEEACLIANDSPKASAAMSRRCLQGIVRDFWNIPKGKRGNLGAEISYIQNEIDPDTFGAIKAVREVGDIGAHMEKSVDTIVDVDPKEAELLIELIETLIEDWYVSRSKRTNRNSALIALADEKRTLKKIAKRNLQREE